MSQLTELVDGAPEEYVKQPGQWRRKGPNGPPIVSDPDGIAVKSGPRAGQVRMLTYSRPSNFGKQVENTYNLEKWNERMVALGIALEWNAACATHRLLGDTAYADLLIDDTDDPAWKKAADGLVVEAKRRAGATIHAERGIHGHGLTEAHDLDESIITRLVDGEDLGLSPALQEAIVDAWGQLIADHFEVLAIEAPCVYDGWRVAGTLDRIVRLKHDLEFELSENSTQVLSAGTVLVLDIKTGGLKTDRNGHPLYWHSYAVQVAAYACGVPYDVDTERRGEWAWPVSTEHAVIAHIDIAGALDTDVVTAQLFYVDLTAGRYAGELVCHAKGWQGRDDVFSPAGSYVVARTIAAPPVQQPGDGTALPSPGTPLTRETVVARASALVAAGYQLALVDAWPPGIPGLRGDHQHTDAELRAIYEAVCKVEDRTGMSPGWVDADRTLDTPPAHLSVVREPDKSSGLPTARESGPAPAPHQGLIDDIKFCEPAPASTIDEGGDVADDAYDDLKAAYAPLDSVALGILAQITKEAAAAGLPIPLRDLRSQRRYWIVKALIAWTDYWDSDVIRDLLAEVMGTDIPRHPATPLGAAFGALSAIEAGQMWSLADCLADGGSVANVDGRWAVIPF